MHIINNADTTFFIKAMSTATIFSTSKYLKLQFKLQPAPTFVINHTYHNIIIREQYLRLNTID